jgi:uncharacterized membrane protein YeaQ/YmgE (transglycosylase-associated protein family)
MSWIELLALLLIAGITGSIAQTLVGISRGGCFISILAGLIGSFLGRWLAGYINLPEILVLNIGGVQFPVFWSLLGAVMFTGFIALFSPRKV